MSSGDYFVGHPVTYTAPAPGTNQAPQVTDTAGGEQTPVTVSTQTPGATHSYNYFVGHPVNPETTTPQPAASPPPVVKYKRRSSFLATCFPCICGSRDFQQ